LLWSIPGVRSEKVFHFLVGAKGVVLCEVIVTGSLVASQAKATLVCK
jgi:hypothetical protein